MTLKIFLPYIFFTFTLFSQNESSDKFDNSQLQSIRIDSITVSGNEKTKSFIILQELTFKNGDTINLEILEYNKNRILSLGLFQKIETYFAQIENKNILDLKVYERWFIFPYPVLGIKYRDWSKIYYGGGIAHQNLFGRNQKIFASFAAGYDPWFNIHYFNPELKYRSGIMLDANINYSRTKNLSQIEGNNNDFDEYWFSTNLSIGKRNGLYNYLWFTIAYNTLEISDKNARKLVSQSNKDNFITLTLSNVYNTRDLDEYPLKGEYIASSISKSGLGESEVDYTKISIDARKYFPIFSGFCLAFRTFGNFSFGGTLPYYTHYYFGYSERIRGHFFDKVEGENSFGFSGELKIPILEPIYYTLKNSPFPEFSIVKFGIYLDVFYDTGEIWNRYNFKIDKRISGYGLGLNFILPYSLILRTEYGFNENRKGEFIIDAGVSF